MTLRLTVDEAAWRAHLYATAAAVDGVLPVVKGNGYGFGRAALLPVAAELSTEVCVGTVHELDGIPAGLTAVVLTPARNPPDAGAVLTVGSPADIEALRGWRGDVVIKLRSSMRRFGVTPGELDALLAAAGAGGLGVTGAAIHLTLAGDDVARRAEVEAWLPCLPAGLPLSVSHLSPAAFTKLRADHPERPWRLRAGGTLWLGDKSFIHLDTEVLAAHQVRAGDTAGYRHTPVPAGGTLAVLGTGSAHGVAPLEGGRSPFHFARRRLALLEPPFMHSSMVVVPDGDPAPAIGDWVDVQQPMINVHADVTEWR